MSRDDQRQFEQNDRAEIYGDRRDSKKKRRNWRDERHQDTRKRDQQRPTRDYLDYEDDE